MTLNLIAKSVDQVQCDTLVVFSKNFSQKDRLPKISHPKVQSRLATAIQNKEITGAALESLIFRDIGVEGFRHVVVIGLGQDTKLDHEGVRQAAAAAYNSIKSLKTKEAAVHFDGAASGAKERANYLRALVEGFELASYNFNELKSKKPETPEVLQIHIATESGKDKTVKAAFEEATILGSCVNFSRRLGDLPGNLMTPTILANEAKAAAQGTGIKVTIWDKERIKKEKMGGLLGVSEGSAQEPRFIIMEYNGAAKSKKPVVFVGKGLTFDCGGISIKPSAAMEEMKYDMCGGANVIGTLLAIAKLKLKVNVIGLVASTENLVGPAATKPGDVHTARNGKTFEVNNTDAEGRLILSDSLVYACEQDPALVVDVATLTGAIIIALGNTHTGYFTRNNQLSRRVEDAAQTSGEWVWRMPLTDFHVKDMKGTFADLSNISSGKGAGSATAAAFLEQFVTEGIPWAHFDIAGTGWAVGNRLNYCPAKGASGAMIRTFVEIAKSYT
ncbi:MAG: leucyl aminopeptidase [Bdellovibrionota bacterium]